MTLNGNNNASDELRMLEEQEVIYKKLHEVSIEDSSQSSMFMEFIRQLRPGWDFFFFF